LGLLDRGADHLLSRHLLLLLQRLLLMLLLSFPFCVEFALERNSGRL
jgi:hypothetical protein